MSVKKVESKRFTSGYGYQIDLRLKGRPRIRQVFETKQLAIEVEAAIRADHARQKYNLPVQSYVTLRELVERHLEGLTRRGRNPKNTVRAGTVLTRFRDLVGADRQVESIKKADLNSYATLRLDAGLQPQSVNREMAEIKSCLSAASSYFPTLEDWHAPRGAWLEESSDGRRQTWGDEEIEAVLRELYAAKRPREKDDHVRSRHMVADMFRVALQTGMRAGEVRRLKKSDVDFRARLIVVKSLKGMSKKRSAKTREIPMTDEVHAILKSRFDSALGTGLFPGRDPNEPLSDHRNAFITACERAGVNYGLDKENGLIFNDARRTAENKMLEAGHQPRAVADIQGHSYETMARHYARSTPQTRRAAIEATKRNNETENAA